MACLDPLTLKGIAITFWLALFSAGMERADSCRPHCTGSYCVTVHRVRVDFKSADEICRKSRGELLSLSPNDDILHTLDYGGYGDFWIGLSLPDGTCTNLSAPLRGYKWESTPQTLDLSVNFWKDSVQVCAPHCVSTSFNLKWTERPCSHEIEGFLCRTDHEHACQVQESTDFFRSTTGCLGGDCEHRCTPVKDGYRCSCNEGYAPDRIDPKKCKIHCAQEKCRPVCEEIDNSVCDCADGFILNENEKMCEDIDECDMNDHNCEQKCKNTYGSYTCSCYKGFVLQDQIKCVPSKDSEYMGITTPSVLAFKPANENSTLKGSSLSTGAFIWLWICLAILVIVFVCVVRWYAVKRQKRIQQNSTQQMTVTEGNNSQC